MNKKLPKFKKKRTNSNNKHKKKKKKNKHKRNSNKDIYTKTDKQSQISQQKQLSLISIDHKTSHATNNENNTNKTISFVESVNIFEQNIPYSTLEMRGYKQIHKISPTLQGQVFVASKTLLHIDCKLV